MTPLLDFFQEEVEQLDSIESEEAGVFRRASAAQQAQRRIIKVPRSGAEMSRPSIENESTPANSNPFRGFSGLSSGSSGPVTPAAVAKAPNPFAGFTGLVSATPALDATSRNLGGVSSVDSSTEHQQKLMKLNAAFSSWIDQQASEHPLSVWTEGMKVRAYLFIHCYHNSI